MHCHLGVSSLKLTPSMETKLGAESDHGDSSTHQCPIPVRHTLGHTDANKFQQTFPERARRKVSFLKLILPPPHQPRTRPCVLIFIQPRTPNEGSYSMTKPDFRLPLTAYYHVNLGCLDQKLLNLDLHALNSRLELGRLIGGDGARNDGSGDPARASKSDLAVIYGDSAKREWS